ncbi:hypothetical protein ABL78_7190 [Leptomonas seymouri]|uniref:Uncharacterized protein n=1 Tax=Leptomonas seymouri TaxID=5684 RepID=A0A0N1HUD1_LEPSE|nr:hypothetical protein ABL78_7190 [Leptomonas seymouri]|eukprot:KPI83774.1 hypothetical protein ABL78_7190 [Leptomonas seymouri]
MSTRPPRHSSPLPPPQGDRRPRLAPHSQSGHTEVLAVVPAAAADACGGCENTGTETFGSGSTAARTMQLCEPLLPTLCADAERVTQGSQPLHSDSAVAAGHAGRDPAETMPRCARLCDVQHHCNTVFTQAGEVFGKAEQYPPREASREKALRGGSEDEASHDAATSTCAGELVVGEPNERAGDGDRLVEESPALLLPLLLLTPPNTEAARDDTQRDPLVPAHDTAEYTSLSGRGADGDVHASSAWRSGSCTQVARLMLPARREPPSSVFDFTILHRVSAPQPMLRANEFDDPTTAVRNVGVLLLRNCEDARSAEVSSNARLAAVSGGHDTGVAPRLSSFAAAAEQAAPSCPPSPSRTAARHLQASPSALTSLWRRPHWQRVRSYARFERAVQGCKRWRDSFIYKDEHLTPVSFDAFSSRGETCLSSSLSAAPGAALRDPMQPWCHAKRHFNRLCSQRCAGCANTEEDCDCEDAFVGAAALWAAEQMCLHDSVREVGDAARTR